MRKRCNRKPVAPVPRWLRPKLTPDQKRDLAICHMENVDAFINGDPKPENFWQWAGSVLTWQRVAQMLEVGVAEMERQAALVSSLSDRYHRTGRYRFTGPEIELAREGVLVMDALADEVDRPTAMLAAEWSEAQLARLQPQKEAA